MLNNIAKKPLVLIVDDVPKNLQVIAAILFEAGYEIAMADNGKVALNMLENMKPDIILLDVMMPEMNGFEVCTLIKANKKLYDIPIIFLTAKSEYENIVKAFHIGAADYVTKPFNSEELLARVKTHIELKQKKELLEQLNSKLEEKVVERTKELKKANEKLSKLDNAKSYFLNLLSHELNTPLTGIQGSLDVLKDDIKDEEQLEFIELIALSTNRLKKFAEDSLLIARLKTEKYDLQKVEENVCLIIRESMIVKNSLADEKNIKFVKKGEIDKFIFPIDYMLCRKCLDNVIENAIKHSPENAVINIKTSFEDDYFVISISDTGSGFAQEALDNSNMLFVSDEIMSHGEGYGLGLATVELIMNAHDGKLEIGNKSEGGALVKIMFER